MTVSRLSSVFQISIYSLAALSSGMLAFAEESWFPASLGVPAAIAALLLSERRRIARLQPVWANGLGLLALLMSSAEFFSDNIEARLLSGAHLLVYLLWIVLFLEKGARQYWWMLALCVLQVAVASVLTSDAWFGAVLVAFFFCAIWTLSVFTLYRSQQRFEAVERPLEEERAATRRGELIASARILRRPGTVRGSIQSDSHERWISLRFAFGTVGWACLAILVAIAFFVLIPRVWIGRGLAADRDGGERVGRSVTGFTDRVRLGDFGRILESREKVLEARIFDEVTGEPVDIESYAAAQGYQEALFRGAVLSRYEDGNWRVDDPRFGSRFTRADRETSQALVRQEIRLQPIGTTYLFALHPVHSCRLAGSTRVVRLHRLNSTLSLHEADSPESEFVYHVWSPREGAPRPLIGNSDRSPQLPPLPMYLRLPSGLDRLRALAAEVVGGGDQDQQPISAAARAERLVSYLRDSGEFGYSLNSSIQDPGIDPIEDFLFHRKTGHCEYFASALTLMLRAVDVPARLVSGFKGGELNRFSGAYEVEQRHAHAWVEANIGSEWLVLDPTPSDARTASVASLGPKLSAWSQFTSLMSGFWGRHVVGMSLSRQRDELYKPLEASIRRWWESLKQGRIETAGLIAGLRRLLTSPERWFSWQGGTVTFVLLLFVAGITWLARRAWRVIVRFRARYRERSRHRVIVEFYERFRRICETSGLRRLPAQTQREHAQGVVGRLNALLAAAGLTEFPDRLVEAFYRVRFGGQALEPGVIEEIDRRLSDLEQLVPRLRSRPASEKTAALTSPHHASAAQT